MNRDQPSASDSVAEMVEILEGNGRCPDLFPHKSMRSRPNKPATNSRAGSLEILFSLLKSIMDGFSKERFRISSSKTLAFSYPFLNFCDLSITLLTILGILLEDPVC